MKKAQRSCMKPVLLLLFVACQLAGLSAASWAGFELPEGEKITNVPHIPRAIPQKEAYEIYDPKIGKNFDVKNFWLRADLRVRPEWRRNTCFGGANAGAGACNIATGAANNVAGKPANDFYVQQWARLGIGYDLSPDVNFYMEIIDSTTWGGNGTVLNAGNNGDPLNHACSNNATATAAGNCRLGVRAAYMLVRNLGGVQGLSMKAGRQYIVFGNHSLFGHFDWANTGYSHDGVMFQYSTKVVDSHLGWFRNSETDIAQNVPVGSLAANVAGTGTGATASGDVDMFLMYNQIKSVPGFVIEPYYVFYSNRLGSADNRAQGLGTAKHSNQLRHMVGNRIEMRKGNWDFLNETAYQFGSMGDSSALNAGNGGNTEQRNLRINAWATRNWLGYTAFQYKWKPRVGIGFDYASGDGRSNCTLNASYGSCKSANTFENFFPTNYIHAGYMLNHAWKNAIQANLNIQARPTRNDHIEFWGQRHYLANARDNWYRGAQGVLVFSQSTNTSNHLGDEVDFAWTHMFADGKVSLTATYGHFMVGEYVRNNLGTNSDQDWAMLQLWMNF
jgi:hypothetical protein